MRVALVQVAGALQVLPRQQGWLAAPHMAQTELWSQPSGAMHVLFG
jgi:hypothetical protein